MRATHNKHAARVLTTAPPPPPIDHDVVETVLALTMHPVCQHVSSLAAGSIQPRRKHSTAPRPRLQAEEPPPPAPPLDVPPTALALHTAASMHAVAALMLGQSSLLALHGALAASLDDGQQEGGDEEGRVGGSVDGGEGKDRVQQQQQQQGMRKLGSRVTLTSLLPARTPPILPVGGCIPLLAVQR